MGSLYIGLAYFCPEAMEREVKERSMAAESGRSAGLDALVFDIWSVAVEDIGP
jgi:hypothetical protein